MLSLIRTKFLRSALAISTALSVIIGQIVPSDALAAISSAPMDPAGDRLRDQLNNVLNTPFDFCDPATEHAHLMAIITASVKLYQHHLGNHHPSPEDIKLAEGKAVQDAKADGAPDDLPYVTDYENAGRRGDKKTQNALFKKMTPTAQAQAAQHDLNYPLVIRLLTPLADAGDVNAQLNLAGIYTLATTGVSAQYLPAPDAKLLKIFKAAGMHWPAAEPPENLLLAFKYFQSAAVKGNVFGQWSLGRAYACGFGTEKDLVRAYAWFCLGLAQRGVTVDMNGSALPSKGHEKDYALDRDFITAQMKPEEIEQAKTLLTQCARSRYKNCD